MENVESLAHLESAVDKLLVAIKEMKQEKLVLMDRLNSRDQEIVTLKQQLQAFQGERSQIEQRISSLLSSIDKWEKSNDSPDVPELSKSGADGRTLF